VSEPTDQVPNKEPDATNGQPRLKICGPDDTELLIEPYPGGYVWKIHNGSLHPINQLRVEIVGAQSSNAKKRAFREPIVLGVLWSIQGLRAGEVTRAPSLPGLKVITLDSATQTGSIRSAGPAAIRPKSSDGF